MTTSVVSFVGIAGSGELESLGSPQWQLSPQPQTAASGLQQQLFAVAGLDEQQLVGSCSIATLLQQEDALADTFASAETFALHVQPDPELKSSGCKPIAAVANIISVASIVRRIVDLLFIVLIPAQMIVGWSDQVKANIRCLRVYVKAEGLTAA